MTSREDRVSRIAAILCIAALPLLAGCAAGPRIVRVPVPAPCIRAGDVPRETPPVGPLPDDARAAADLLAATLLQVRGENVLLRAVIAGCRSGAE